VVGRMDGSILPTILQLKSVPRWYQTLEFSNNLEKVAHLSNKSDPKAVGQAFYEVMTIDLREKVKRTVLYTFDETDNPRYTLIGQSNTI